MGVGLQATPMYIQAGIQKGKEFMESWKQHAPNSFAGLNIDQPVHHFEEMSKKLPWDDIIDVGEKLVASAVAETTESNQAALKKSGLKLVTTIDNMIPNHHNLILI